MSSRDIEGQNPLYLPQAKVYDGCCALGPCILLPMKTPAETTEVRMEILRSGAMLTLAGMPQVVLNVVTPACPGGPANPEARAALTRVKGGLPC